MFGWPTRSWFYNCTKLAHQERDAKSQWLADILSNHGERIAAELDVQRVLSNLLYEGVFSLEEYRDILSQECCKTRAACFVEKLSGKGPRAFSAFCAALEEICPQLLTSLLLDYPGVTNRSVPDTSSENSERREASEMDVREVSEANDLDGNPFAEDQTNHSFNRWNLIPKNKESFTENYRTTFEERITPSQANVPPTQPCINSHTAENQGNGFSCQPGGQSEAAGSADIYKYGVAWGSTETLSEMLKPSQKKGIG